MTAEPGSPTQQRGWQAEDAALAFLTAKGLSLIARNYHCRMGEIDLILSDGKLLIFVEVRMRGSQRYGGAAASVTRRKQARIIRAAERFRQQHVEWRKYHCRFDIVAIQYEADSGQNSQGAVIEWIQGAFRT
jgi:putative endonuclease